MGKGGVEKYQKERSKRCKERGRRNKMTIVHLVEKQVIKKQAEIYPALDAASFSAKNLYNLVN
jgi:hypothetical protein